MKNYLAAAAALAFVVGVVHSALGEWLIFRRMRQGRLIPTNGGKIIGEGHVRILWASWHALTVFGWLAAAILLWLSVVPVPQGVQALLSTLIAIAMSIAASLVLVGTRGKHPGWVGLLGVGVLAWLGRAT